MPQHSLFPPYAPLTQGPRITIYCLDLARRTISPLISHHQLSLHISKNPSTTLLNHLHLRSQIPQHKQNEIHSHPLRPSGHRIPRLGRRTRHPRLHRRHQHRGPRRQVERPNSHGKARAKPTADAKKTATRLAWILSAAIAL